MTILALEFSSDTRSVALLRNGATIETVETGGRNTAAFRMIESVLSQAGIEREQVDAIAVGLGPGSYTGIRAAIAIAHGWKLTRPIRLLGVSSAAAIAARAQSEKIFGRVDVIIDAQRGEVYRAGYEVSENEVKEIEPLRIVIPNEVGSSRCDDPPSQGYGEASRTAQRAVPTLVVGPEVTRWFSSGKMLGPTASMVARLASVTAEGELEPIYLRETTFVKAPPSRVIT